MVKMMRTEVWANGKKWRMITLHTRTGDIQYSWGAYDYTVEHFLKSFGGSLGATMDGAHGSGSERWYRRATEADLTRIRKSAQKAGFKRLGEF